MNVPRSSVVELTASKWFLFLLLSALSVFMLISISGPMGATNITADYLPMQARYIEFFGLANPLHSFFFWALTGMLSTSLIVRGLRNGASMIRTAMVVTTIIAGSIGFLSVNRTAQTSGYTVEMPETGVLTMEPGSVYQLSVNGRTEQAGLRLTDAGPLVFRQSSGGLSVFIPASGSTDARIRLCTPENYHITNLGRLLLLLALLTFIIGISLPLFTGKKT